jgi:hypothetical protein
VCNFACDTNFVREPPETTSFSLTIVDRDPHFVTLAYTHFTNIHPEVGLRAGSIETLLTGEEFDAVVLPGNPFGYARRGIAEQG